MNEIQAFNNPEFGGIRAVEINGEPWLVLRDVCAALEMTTPARVAERLEKDEVSQTHIIDSLGRQQETTIINESGFYSVVLRSDKPKAKPFRKWVTSEVLPSIRKHGAYMTPDVLEQTIQNPDFMIGLLNELKAEQEKSNGLQIQVSRLTVENQIMKPKAEYFDELVDRNLLTNIRDTAKELGIQQKKFVEFLLDKKYLYRDNKGKLKPYAKHVEAGLFEIKEFSNKATGYADNQTLITPKGRETFRILLIGA